jgi:hypothetical protein
MEDSRPIESGKPYQKWGCIPTQLLKPSPSWLPKCRELGSLLGLEVYS